MLAAVCARKRKRSCVAQGRKTKTRKKVETNKLSGIFSDMEEVQQDEKNALLPM